MKHNRQNFSQKAIAFLLTLQLTLICVQAQNRLHQGDSPIEVLMWMINQSIPVLKQISSVEDKLKKSVDAQQQNKSDRH